MRRYRVSFRDGLGEPNAPPLFVAEVLAECAWSALDAANDPNDARFAALPGFCVQHAVSVDGGPVEQAACQLVRRTAGLEGGGQ